MSFGSKLCLPSLIRMGLVTVACGIGVFGGLAPTCVVGQEVPPPDSTETAPDDETAPADETASPSILPAKNSEITDELIATRRGELDSATSLSDEAKATATQYYEQAAKELRAAAEQTQNLETWKKLREEAPEKLKQLRAELEQPPAKSTLELPDSPSLEELDQMLATARQELALAETSVADLRAERKRREDRRAQMADLNQAAKDRLAQIEKALAAPPPPGMPPEVVLAQRTAQEASKVLAQKSLEALSSELPTYDATTELLTLELQRAQRLVNLRKEELERINELADSRRREIAQEQEHRAQMAVIQASPAVKDVAQQNLKLAQRLSGEDGLAEKIEENRYKLENAKSKMAEITEIESELDDKLGLLGGETYASDWLSQLRGDLPQISELQRELYLRNQELNVCKFQLADARREISQLADTSDEVDKILAKLDSQLSQEQRSQIVEAANSLYTERVELLQKLEREYTVYINLLSDLNTQQQELLAKTREIRSEVESNLLWVRTGSVFTWTNLTDSWQAFQWLIEGENWRQVGDDLLSALRNRSFSFLVFAAVFGVLAVLRRPCKQRLRKLGDVAGSSYLAPFKTTMKALGYTILLTLLWPWLMFGFGFCVYWYVGAGEFTRAVAAGSATTSLIFLSLEFARRVAGRRGLAEAHFRWSTRKIELVRRNLTWAILVGLPIIFMHAMISWQGNPLRQESLGRFLFVVVMILVSVFMQRVLRPLPAAEDSPVLRRRYITAEIIYYTATILPLIVALLSIAGYHFTAMQLAVRMFLTANLGLLMLVCHGLAVRWLRLVRGNLALQQARQRQAAREQAADSETRTQEEAVADVEPEIDLQTVNVQTRQLLFVSVAVTGVIGLWLIWLDVMPFGQYLESPVWTSTHQVTKLVNESDGTQSSQVVSVTELVTWGDLVIGVLIAIVAVIASRNIPGLVEVGLPQNVPLDAGARYALSTVIRYSLVALGIVVASSVVGISWSNVQWMLAALSVGVGFGLQELIANFVSGLILLFERPVRVGDIVTVDGVTGVVTRIQIRATTIRNWDRQDYLVPNKDLITGRVLNWTLSSQLNRVVVQVGVSYDSDPRQVRELLFEILRDEPNILEDPAPLVTFEAFGDSALQFVVRAYLDNMDCRLETINDLHSTIFERFKAAGIEIAFPQQDIHIRHFPEVKQDTPGLAVMPVQATRGNNGPTSGNGDSQSHS